jgi:hypothetical protein
MAAADLNGLIEWPAVECLNQKPGHTIQNALKQVRMIWGTEPPGLSTTDASVIAAAWRVCWGLAGA